jgi:predicted aminopeptidase
MLTLEGCQAGYVVEQGWRQLRLRSHQVSIDDPEALEKLKPAARARLEWVPRILDFARTELDLDPGDSYRTYLDTGGEPVSHAVTAAHPLALVPYEWSFPFVGRVPYKGYFEEEDARAEAARLDEEGLDVDVFPVGAFSTLGWFRDPVLSTMPDGSLAGLVDIILHETTHRTVYFPGRAEFNESLASHVAEEGTVRFLLSHPELRPLLPGYIASRRRAAERETLLHRLRNDLDALYRSAAPADGKRARKREIFATAAEAYRHLVPQAAPDAIPPSNAFVLTVSWYGGHRRLLRRLQEHVGGNPSDLVAYLGELPASDDPVPAIEELLGEETGSAPGALSVTYR